MMITLLTAALAVADMSALYDAAQTSVNQVAKQQAELQLGEALEEAGFVVPALYYYKNIFSVGKTHLGFDKAVSHLVKLAAELRDDFVVPTILNAKFDPDAFEKLDATTVNAINYMIGALSYRQQKYDDANAFLSAVAPGSTQYLKARYLLGVVLVRKGDHKGSIPFFQDIVTAIKASDEDQASLRNLAILGQARAYYATGQFAKATELYRSIPRYSQEWYDALFENGWAYFQQEDYGRALGEVESVLSPHFNKRFRPEAFVLAATVYYSNCQFDRTRTMLDAFRGTYEPMLDKLKAYLQVSRREQDHYKNLIDTSPQIPLEVLRQVRRNGRFLNYHRLISEIEREQQLIGDVQMRPNLRDEVAAILRDQREQFSDYTGRWVKGQLQNQVAVMTQFVNQARLIKLETATSEIEIIQAGGKVAGKERKRMPRPDIPNDQYQHWNLRGEYWVDELGYYVHSIRKECQETQ